ncbi:hypothetical protein IAT38_006787 [Cryptococcus sp. DSM 104549]
MDSTASTTTTAIHPALHSPSVTALQHHHQQRAAHTLRRKASVPQTASLTSPDWQQLDEHRQEPKSSPPQKLSSAYQGAVTKKRPGLQRNSSAYLRKLQLDRALEKERFGLGDVHISTSPYEEEIFIQLSPGTATDSGTTSGPEDIASSSEDGDRTSPKDTTSIDNMPTTNSPSASSQTSSNRTPTAPSSSSPSISVPTTARMRHPPPPSPLSKVQPSSPEKSSHIGSLMTDNGNLAAPSPAALAMPQSSPCFIHSHLDRHGSLQDWLKNKSNYPQAPHGSSSSVTGSTTSTTAHPASGAGHNHTGGNAHGHLHAHQHQHQQGNATKPLHHSSPYSPGPRHTAHAHPHAHAHAASQPESPSPSRSQATSPTSRSSSRLSHAKSKDMGFSGYDSDASSGAPNGRVNGEVNGGSAILDGDMMDDDDAGSGSLTRQLAETAQGVREMSKELGRTKVRSRIQHVLIVTKARDNRLIKLTRELALYIMQKRPATSPDGSSSRHGNDSRDRGMVVYVDAQLRTSKRFDAAGMARDYPNLFKPMERRRSSSSASVSTLSTLSAFSSTTSMGDAARKSKDEGQLRYWTSEMCSNSPHLFDFVVTLGGDGTVLFTSWLFQRIVPPVLPFALGSLGFLTNFDFKLYKDTMDKVIDEGIRVNLRMRFTCTVYRAIAPEEAALVSQKGKKRKAIKKPGGEILMSRVDKGGWESLEGPTPVVPPSGSEGEDKEIMCYSTRPVEQFEVLNDLVVDRGPSPYVSLLELFGDEHHLTTVQADGLTVSTPTGSTAYSLSAGGSLVHPQIPAILITPICPHTLSFRPMLLPDSMELRVCVPYNSRSTAWASFDGRGRVELKQGDHIKVTASKYPFPTVCADKASTDWFSSISRTLRWNEREKQKSFVVVEEASEPPAKHNSGGKSAAKKQVFDESKATPRYREAAVAAGDDVIDLDDEEEDEDDEEEDEVYDIDDKSGGETQPSSPPIPPENDTNKLPPSHLHSLLASHQKSGLQTPNRFATPYQAPPALSQRHLIEALAAAEIREKENEEGQRDDIRGDGSAFRVDGGHHLIPPGRSQLPSPELSTSTTGESETEGPGDRGRDGERRMMDEKTPKPESHHHHHHHQHEHHHSHSPHRQRKHSQGHVAEKLSECKAKAFAFFGQDDSASDLSDDHSE